MVRWYLGFIDSDVLEFVINSVYVDLKYNDVTFTTGLCDCVVCVGMWSSLVCL